MEADLNVSFQSIVRKSLMIGEVWHTAPERSLSFKRNDILITRSKIKHMHGRIDHMEELITKDL